MSGSAPVLSPIAARLAGVKWIDNHIFETHGVRFYIDERHGDTDSDLPWVVIAKNPEWFGHYADELGAAPTRNVLEFGVWKGGSALALTALFDAHKYVAIDICDPVPAFDAIRAGNPIGRRMAIHYNTSQDDQAALDRIITQEFDGPVDVIIDDASHAYGFTKRTLELTFRYLRPGGWYVIEDWAWAHAPLWTMWNDRPALTNLILELTILNASRPDLFDRMVVRPQAVFLHKADNAPDMGVLDLDALCYLGERKLTPF